MKTKPTAAVQELNRVVSDFDAATAYEFDRETDPQTLILFAAVVGNGHDLPRRMAKAFRDVEVEASDRAPDHGIAR